MTSSSAPSGRLVAFEGIDGCGKTTQAQLLAASIGALLTHEPGATPLGGELRRLLLGAGPSGARAVEVGALLSDRAEALLMAADRAQHVAEVVRPALASGRHVVTDRFSASTLAYQGYGRGLDLSSLRTLVAWAAGGLEPDLYVLVDVPATIARRRLSSDPDRLERLDETFFDRVREGYLSMSAEDPARWAVVDGTEGIGAVAREVAAVVSDRTGVAVPG